ncbi:MAG: GatB/YqeY domain-containing protein [Acidobacteriaceae bacterium]|jgi:uncharacterized protein
MELVKKIDHDMVAAMKARDVERTSTLRMAKSALKNKAIEKRGDLTDAEAQQVFNTMINQRKDSIEQFTKGNRPELAAKEAREIVTLESYLPKTASEEDLKKIVEETLAGGSFGPRDMGAAMKAVQARIQQQGWRADGRQLSELVKARLGQ